VTALEIIHLHTFAKFDQIFILIKYHALLRNQIILLILVRVSILLLSLVDLLQLIQHILKLFDFLWDVLNIDTFLAVVVYVRDRVKFVH